MVIHNINNKIIHNTNLVAPIHKHQLNQQQLLYRRQEITYLSTNDFLKRPMTFPCFFLAFLLFQEDFASRL